MKPAHLYLCGPMTGLPDSNYPAFQEAAKRLRAAGFTVTNPAENGLPQSANWFEHMRTDIRNMMSTDAVAVLDGWQRSKGAQLEIQLAENLGMKVASIWVWLAAQAVGQCEESPL